MISLASSSKEEYIVGRRKHKDSCKPEDVEAPENMLHDECRRARPKDQMPLTIIKAKTDDILSAIILM